MDTIIKGQWWALMQAGVFCAALGLLGAIVVGVF
ncbi:MAG: hypothetical protein JWR08_2398 [Enterovirga sp.]|jgi:hypothetical protein|nr:hypothetical protein [Enterovirga sp.]